MKSFANLQELAAAAGTELGTTDWLVVDQQRIDRFAEATGDHEWIHVDTEKAADGPWGATIAHGLLTLSLLPTFVEQLYDAGGVRLAVNYGFDKVRFITPVRVGSKVRATGSLVAVNEVPGGVQVTLAVTVELDGSTKPACFAEWLLRYLE